MSWGAWILLVVLPGRDPVRRSRRWPTRTSRRSRSGRRASPRLVRALPALRARPRARAPDGRGGRRRSGSAATPASCSPPSARARCGARRSSARSSSSPGSRAAPRSPCCSRSTTEERGFLARADVHAMWLELALIVFFLVGLSTGGADARAAAGLILGGPLHRAVLGARGGGRARRPVADGAPRAAAPPRGHRGRAGARPRRRVRPALDPGRGRAAIAGAG